MRSCGDDTRALSSLLYLEHAARQLSTRPAIIERSRPVEISKIPVHHLPSQYLQSSVLTNQYLNIDLDLYLQQFLVLSCTS